MGRMKALMMRIELRPSFIVLAVLSIALGYMEQFFILFFAVSLHEASHIAAAFFLKLSIQKIIITPLGQMAVIPDLESETSIRRAVVYAAGPLASFALFLFFFIINQSDFHPWMRANLALCLVNLLPVYPLDGGQLLRLLLGNTWGVIRANRALCSFGQIMSILLILVGLVQLILFPYNVSLYCVGFYLYKTSGSEYLNLTYAFYKKIFFGQSKLNEKKIMPVNVAVVHQNEPIKNIITWLRFDSFFMFHVTDGQKIIRRVTEDEIVRHISHCGLVGRVGDIIVDESDSCQTGAHTLY